MSHKLFAKCCDVVAHIYKCFGWFFIYFWEIDLKWLFLPPGVQCTSEMCFPKILSTLGTYTSSEKNKLPGQIFLMLNFHFQKCWKDVHICEYWRFSIFATTAHEKIIQQVSFGVMESWGRHLDARKKIFEIFWFFRNFFFYFFLNLSLKCMLFTSFFDHVNFWRSQKRYYRYWNPNIRYNSPSRLYLRKKKLF